MSCLLGSTGGNPCGKMASLRRRSCIACCCTIGCSNPACVNLKGASEVKVSCKACPGCKVVYYCSRKCQVVHWTVQKGICKKLPASNPGGTEGRKGGGKQGAAGEVSYHIASCTIQLLPEAAATK